ncbi:MAG TPA: hypothetical protein VIY52_19975 [Streptosporangiaceae bacterium]
MTSGWIVVSPLAGVVGAGAVVGAVRWKMKAVPWRNPVDGGASWSLFDSWLTNLAALFGFSGTLWTALGNLAAVGVSASVSVMFVVCGGSAALSPVIYAALASKQADADTGNAIGTVVGLLAAAAATLFASFGELAAISLVAWQASAALAARISASLVQVLILAAAGCVCAYSGRTLYSIISQTKAKPAMADKNVRPMSYLATAAATVRRSATL